MPFINDGITSRKKGCTMICILSRISPSNSSALSSLSRSHTLAKMYSFSRPPMSDLLKWLLRKWWNVAASPGHTSLPASTMESACVQPGFTLCRKFSAVMDLL